MAAVNAQGPRLAALAEGYADLLRLVTAAVPTPARPGFLAAVAAHLRDPGAPFAPIFHGLAPAEDGALDPAALAGQRRRAPAAAAGRRRPRACWPRRCASCSSSTCSWPASGSRGEADEALGHGGAAPADGARGAGRSGDRPAPLRHRGLPGLGRAAQGGAGGLPRRRAARLPAGRRRAAPLPPRREAGADHPRRGPGPGARPRRRPSATPATPASRTGPRSPPSGSASRWRATRMPASLAGRRLPGAGGLAPPEQAPPRPRPRQRLRGGGARWRPRRARRPAPRRWPGPACPTSSGRSASARTAPTRRWGAPCSPPTRRPRPGAPPAIASCAASPSPPSSRSSSTAGWRSGWPTASSPWRWPATC